MVVLFSLAPEQSVEHMSYGNVFFEPSVLLAQARSEHTLSLQLFAFFHSCFGQKDLLKGNEPIVAVKKTSHNDCFPASYYVYKLMLEMEKYCSIQYSVYKQTKNCLLEIITHSCTIQKNKWVFH